MATVVIDDNEFVNVKLAISEEEQKQGLKNVRNPMLMAFPYKQASVRKFWMHDTPAPLDIIFCNGTKVIYIGKGEPYDAKTLIGPDTACTLVLEAPAGFVISNNIS